jgi:hypothetical protein
MDNSELGSHSTRDCGTNHLKSKAAAKAPPSWGNEPSCVGWSYSGEGVCHGTGKRHVQHE